MSRSSSSVLQKIFLFPAACFYSFVAGERIFCKNLDTSETFTIVALETKNDRRDDDA